MPAKTKKICIYTGAEGHYSISTSITETLESRGYEVETYFEREPMFDYYVPIYRFMPQVFKAPYELSKNEKAAQLLQEFLLQRYRKKMETHFEKHRPDAIVSTYFAYNPALEKIGQLTQTPFFNVITDPRTFHPVHLSRLATTNLLFDQEGVTLAQEFSPESPVTVSGWFVRKAFSTEPDIAALKKKLMRKHRGLKTDVLTFFIASGSEGTNLVMKILPALFALSQPVQVIVACGSNTMLLRSVRAFGRFLHSTRKNSSLIALPFTNSIHEYMMISDLIIGKAGPNTLFEAVACNKPFMAISHISGQESGNLDIIRDYQLGYVEENPIRATRLLQDIVEQPDVLHHWKKPIAALRKHNLKAGDVLLKAVESAL